MVCGRSSMAEQKLPKLTTGVRFSLGHSRSLDFSKILVQLVWIIQSCKTNGDNNCPHSGLSSEEKRG